MRIVAPIPKKSSQQAKFANLFFVQQFYTLYVQNHPNLRPLLSNTFPQKFRKSTKFGHWTLGSGGKKIFNQSVQMKKKNIRKKLFCCSEWQVVQGDFPIKFGPKTQKRPRSIYKKNLRSFQNYDLKIQQEIHFSYFFLFAVKKP